MTAEEIFETNERTAFEVAMEWRDALGGPEVPDSVEVQIHDVEDLEIRAKAPLTPPAADMVFTVTSTDTAVLNDRLAHLDRIITISASFGADNELHREVRFRVNSLRHVP